MRFIFLLRVLCLLSVLLLGSVQAAPSTYTGEAPVNSQSDADRAGALKTALAEVVIAQTGDAGILARPKVASAVAQAERYVLQYQYRDNPAGAEGEARMTLIAEFDAVAVDRMLQQLGVGAAEQATAVADAPSEATVWIGGIRDGGDYVRVMAYLLHSNFVRSAQPLQAHGDGMLVQLALATGLADFLDALELERTLSKAPAPLEGSDAALVLLP